MRMEPGIQTPEETLTKASGSCRDSGWLLVQILRHFGFAARFVSGYLIQLRPDVKSLDGADAGADADFTDLHAWAEVYLPGAGWIGLDPTSGLLAGEGHIPLAATPHPSSAAPITGAHEPAEVTFAFDMSVERILRNAARHDALHRGDLEADRRRRRRGRRAPRQRRRAPHHGRRADVRLHRRHGQRRVEDRRRRPDQARAMPRIWSAACSSASRRAACCTTARASGIPASSCRGGRSRSIGGATGSRCGAIRASSTARTSRRKPPSTMPRSCMGALCTQLGLPADSGIPAYEDPGYFVLVEQKLPLNVSPEENKLEDPAERARIMRVFEHGLDKPASYVLPVQVWQSPDRGRRWVTERWGTRRGKLFLMPGDSPAGFRLPLGSLAALPAVDYPHVLPRDPLGEAPPLPERAVLIQQRKPSRCGRRLCPPPSGPQRDLRLGAHRAGHRAARRASVRVHAAASRMRSTIAALIAAIEEAAAAAKLPVHIEGYSPPRRSAHQRHQGDARPRRHRGQHPSGDELGRGRQHHHRPLRGGAARRGWAPRSSCSTAATPAPAAATTSCWAASRRPTARSCAAPTCSPSIIAYWQNHPSLSYLFSGLFIGPTSQAPRIDEARHEALYEMEIALEADSRPGARHRSAMARRPHLPQPAGRRDRQHAPRRDLHRQALLARRPDGPPRACRVPLLRDAAARAHEPRAAAADARLHRHVLGAPLSRQAGPLGHGAARPLHAAAFPVGGLHRGDRRSARRPACRSSSTGSRRTSSSASRSSAKSKRAGVALELRQALEPWHVLGEESAAGGTARYVDNSLDRVQVHGARRRQRPLCRHLQRPRPAADQHRHVRRKGRRRPLPRLAAGLGAASDHPAARAAGVRRHGHVDGPLGRRLPLSRRAPRRPQPRFRARSTPTRRKAGAWRASNGSAIRPAARRLRRRRSTPSTR